MKKAGLLLSLLPLWLLLTGFYLLDPRIIGGEDETEPPPYLAYMLIEFEDGTFQQCGASYIADRAALTAAHCLFNGNNELAKEVYLAFNVEAGDVSALTLDDFVSSTRFEIYPGYDNANFNTNPTRDAAIIYLMDVPDDVKPIAMADATLTDSLQTNRAEVKAYGWGLIDSDDQVGSDVLQKVNLRMDNRNSYDNKSIWDRFEDWVVFAGSTDVGKDTCKGDSGGPLVYFQHGIPVLVGITSFGPNDCASDDQPGGYVRVARIRDWAQDLDTGLFKIQDTVLARRVDESAGALSPLMLVLLVPALVAVRRRVLGRRAQ